MILPNRYTYVGASSFIFELDELMDMYGMITVPDVYDLQRLDNAALVLPAFTYEDNKYGWVSSTLKAKIIGNCERGYAIELGRPLPLE